MKLSEIIAEIDEKFPAATAFSSDSKVRKINRLQKIIFRTEVSLVTSKAYDLLKDISLYPVPLNPSNVIEVLVEGRNYPHREIEERSLKRYYYFFDGGIGIYPSPTRDINGGLLVFYRPDPVELSASNLSATPDLDSDFHDLLVYGVCKDIAESVREFDIATGFAIQYNDLLQKFVSASQSAEPGQVAERW